MQGLAAAVGALLPENAIVVDEAMTSGRGMMAATAGAPAHDWLGNTGGSIGIALPLAVGAAVACPDRRVLCLTADGSGMYTVQALWTMAREGLNVTTVVFANRSYAVLQREFSGLGVGAPGPRASALFDIGRPTLDWVHLAKGMGVPAGRVTTLEAFAKALKEGFESADLLDRSSAVKVCRRILISLREVLSRARIGARRCRHFAELILANFSSWSQRHFTN